MARKPDKKTELLMKGNPKESRSEIMNKKVEELVERVRLTPQAKAEIFKGYGQEHFSNMSEVVDNIAQVQLNQVLNDPDIVLIDRERELPAIFPQEFHHQALKDYRAEVLKAGFTHSIIS